MSVRPGESGRRETDGFPPQSTPGGPVRSPPPDERAQPRNHPTEWQGMIRLADIGPEHALMESYTLKY